MWWKGKKMHVQKFENKMSHYFYVPPSDYPEKFICHFVCLRHGPPVLGQAGGVAEVYE
jgi:hypothetical protein